MMMIDSSPPTETMRHEDDNMPTRTTTMTTKRDKFKSKRPRTTTARTIDHKMKEKMASLEEILQLLQEGMNIQVGRVTLSLNEALVGHQPVMIIQIPTKQLLLSEDSQPNENHCMFGHEISDQQLPFYRITVFVVSSSSPGYTDALQQNVLESLAILTKSRATELNNRFQSMNHSNRCHTLSYSDASQEQRFKLVVGRLQDNSINTSSEYLFQIHWDKQFLFQGADTKYWYQFVEQDFQLDLPTPSEKTNGEFVLSNLRLDYARCAALAESFHGMKLKFVDCIIENDQAFSKCSHPLHFSGCILSGDAVELAQAIGRNQGPREITFDHTFFHIPAFCKALRSTQTLNVFKCLNCFDELVDHDHLEVEELCLNVDELLSSVHKFSASLDTFAVEGALSDEALIDQSTLKTALSNSTISHQTLKIYNTDGSPIEWEAFDKMQDLLEHNFIVQSLELNLHGCHQALQAQSTIEGICMRNRYLKNARHSSTLIGQTRNTAILGAAISHGRIRSSNNHEALWALIRANSDLVTMQRLELKVQSDGNKMEAG